MRGANSVLVNEVEQAQADHDDDEAHGSDVIVTEKDDLRHHLPVSSGRRERQQALDHENEGQRRQDFAPRHCL